MLLDQAGEVGAGAEDLEAVVAHALFAGVVIDVADDLVEAAEVGAAQNPGGKLACPAGADDQDAFAGANTALAQVDPAGGQAGDEAGAVADDDEGEQDRNAGNQDEGIREAGLVGEELLEEDEEDDGDAGMKITA